MKLDWIVFTQVSDTFFGFPKPISLYLQLQYKVVRKNKILIYLTIHLTSLCMPTSDNQYLSSSDSFRFLHIYYLLGLHHNHHPQTANSVISMPIHKAQYLQHLTASACQANRWNNRVGRSFLGYEILTQVTLMDSSPGRDKSNPHMCWFGIWE